MRRKAMVAALAAWGVMAGAALSGSVPLGDDGLHKPDWLKDSFKDVREDAAEAAVDAWIGPRLSTVEGVRASVDEIEHSGSGWTFAKLTIANATIRDLAGAAIATA